MQLIDASAMHAPMRKSLGSKRKYLSDEQIAEIAKLHEAFEEGQNSKIFSTTDFGYRRITVERPLRLRFSVTPDKLAVYRDTKGADQVEAFAGVQCEFDNLSAFLKAAGIKKLGKGALKAALACFGERDANAQPVLDDKGNLQADSDLREFENVPLSQSIDDYFAREVLPMYRMPGSTRASGTRRTARLASSATRSTSTATSTSTSRRARWPRSMRISRPWRPRLPRCWGR